ncbi:MAG: hypothetical protein KAR19_18590 [Bacteroidales bacterium]|nr:hypothetical protein [Bacteroidales bacterium]
MLYSRNLGSTDFGTYYALDIFYVLGSQIRRIQGTSYYGITFSVDSLFKDESGDYHLSRIDWNNNIYLIDREYSLNNTIEEIVKLIVGDLDHFENNNQFKIRVKVDEFTEPVEHINSRQFTRWLTQILNNHELIKQQYVFYYEDEFYPVEQDNKFYGTFRDARPPDDNMLKVDISIFIDNDDKPCDLVVIHSENYRRDDDYKDKIIEAVLEKLVIK